MLCGTYDISLSRYITIFESDKTSLPQNIINMADCNAIELDFLIRKDQTNNRTHPEAQPETPPEARPDIIHESQLPPRAVFIRKVSLSSQ